MQSQIVDHLGAVSQLESAVLVYASTISDHRGFENKTYVAVHSPVVHLPGGQAVLGPGKPLRQDTVRRIFEGAATQESSEVRILPEKVLLALPDLWVWWRAPRVEAMSFSADRAMKNGSAIQPGLVFCVTPQKWVVYALVEGKRPTEDTPLYRAPYDNVWVTGQICVGDAHLPQHASVESLALYEYAFFDTEFTHTNYALDSAPQTSYPNGTAALWQHLIQTQAEHFPVQYLEPYGYTLGDAILALRKGG